GGHGRAHAASGHGSPGLAEAARIYSADGRRVTARERWDSVMDIVVRGKNVEVPARLRKLARAKVRKISRFTHDAGRVEVDFSELRNRRVAANQVCDGIVHLKRTLGRAHAAATDPAAALDLVLDKVEHQVARIKEKRVTRTHAARRGRAAGNDAGASLVDGDDGEELDAASRIVTTKRLTT